VGNPTHKKSLHVRVNKVIVVVGIRADTSISALRNTEDRLQLEITLKSNMEQSQVTYIEILRSCCQSKFDCLIYEMLFIKELKPTLNKQSDSIRAKIFI